jgi:oligoribonuclease
MNNQNILWVDVETTGLIPYEGQLLEVALLATDYRLDEIAYCSFVIKPTSGTVFSEFINDMHTKSGLIDKLATGIGLKECESVLIDFVANNDCAKVPLAGSSVGFDRGWLNHHMPTLSKLFHYRNIDVSSFMELCDRIGVELRTGGAPAHRAIDDVRDSLEKARKVRALLCP